MKEQMLNEVTEDLAAPSSEDHFSQAMNLIAELRNALNSISKSLDNAFDEDIRKADAFLAVNKSAMVIGPWDSRRYGQQENPQGMDVETVLTDRRKDAGQVFFDMQVSGDTEDVLSVIAEVADHPESGQPTPVLHIYRGDARIIAAYADGRDKTLLVVDQDGINEGLLRLKNEGGA